MYIVNDAVSPGIMQKNRCYIWEKLSTKAINDDQFEDDYHIEDDDLNFIENDFYAGKAKKKLTQMDDPNNSMIVLRYEQESKDLALIRMIRNDLIWFLNEGPYGTDEFFYSYIEEGKFLPK